MTKTFYNQHGEPVIYTDDEVHLFDFDGNPIAYFHDNSVYNYSGQHLGWYENEWIRDPDGDCFLFSEKARGGPLKPLKQLKPLKRLKELKPLKSIRELKPLKPLSTLSWSTLTMNDFFRND